AHAQAELGRCCLHGLGIDQDAVRGEALLRMAAEGGWQPALGELERYWFAQAEAALSGPEGLRDAETAAVLYRKAGELGHRRACLMLGQCYRHGVGVAPDHRQALTWFRRAATLFDAKVALADMYYYGQGVEQNYREAVRWLREAVAQHEDAYALYSLAYCLLHGQGVQIDVRSGLRYLRRAAVLGDAGAQYELGSAYYRGQWLVRNPKQALRWLRSAAASGHEEARGFIERIQREGALN
ncbi:MAG TPA: SEL1-like repeat protein, partial [Rhodocyclaceae bacterium]|nr:SEL1-like repeat protein [Rhodocyclaceae bacterium]